MPPFKLITQRLDTGSQLGSAEATLLNSAVGGRISAPTINIRAADVRYTNMTPNEIVPNKSISAMGQALDIMTKSAFAYSQREDKFVADSRTLDLGAELKELFSGEKGYKRTTLGEAAKGYKGYHATVEEKVKAALDELTPQQQFYAFNQVKALKNTYLGKGANHAVSQLASAEEDLRNREFTSELSRWNEGEGTLESMSHALSLFSGDAKDHKARSTQLTETALYATLGMGSAVEVKNAFALATNMFSKGVGDPKAIQTFVDKVKTNEYTDKTRAAEIQALEEKEREDATTLFWANNAVNALSRGELGSVLGRLSKQIPSDEFNEFVEKRIGSLVAESVVQEAGFGENLDMARGLAKTREKLFEQMKDIPANLHDEIYKELDSQQEMLDKKSRQSIDDEVKVRNFKERLKKDAEITQIQESIAPFLNPASPEHDNAMQTLSYLAVNSPNESVRIRANRLLNNEVNPLEDQVLARAEEDKQAYIDGTLNPWDLDVSHTKLRAFIKDVEADRKSGGAPDRKAGASELLTYYQLEKTPMGSFTLSADARNVDKDTAKRNYFEALRYYNTLYTEYTTGDKKMGSASAASEAINNVLNTPTYSNKMTHKPKGMKGENKLQEGEEFGYFGDLDKVYQTWKIEDKLPGLKGSANLALWVKTIGATKETEGVIPEVAFRQRVAEQGEVLKNMLKTAATKAEKLHIETIIRNFRQQAEAIQDGIGESNAVYKQVGEVTSAVDGDTFKQKTGEGESKSGKRSADINTPEMDTPEGQSALDQFWRFLQALTGGSDMVETTTTQPGTGAYNRPIVSTRVPGGGDLEKIQKSRGGQPAYSSPKKEQ